MAPPSFTKNRGGRYDKRREEPLQRSAALRDLLRHIPDLPAKLTFAATYLCGAVYVGLKYEEWHALSERIELLSPILKATMGHALIAYLLVGDTALLELLLYPFGRRAAKDQPQCISLVNHAGMPPELLCKRRDNENSRVMVREFRNQSIPLQE